MLKSNVAVVRYRRESLESKKDDGRALVIPECARPGVDRNEDAEASEFAKVQQNSSAVRMSLKQNR
jgi:hypothetical protein